jgi:hypothetical protein
MDENGWNIDAIGTGHAIFAVIAWYVFQTDNPFCHVVFQVLLFSLGKWL